MLTAGTYFDPHDQHTLGRRLDDVINGLDSEIDVERRILIGRPSREISDESQRLDLLSVGSRSHGRLQRVLLGTVSALLVLSPRCPVLVLPRGIRDGAALPAAPASRGTGGDDCRRVPVARASLHKPSRRPDSNRGPLHYE